jgi:DNA-binding FadR family transcriptional regulator
VLRPGSDLALEGVHPFDSFIEPIDNIFVVPTKGTTSPPPYRTMHQHVIDVLGLEIVSGTPPPGGKLEPEQPLCERLGVSRGALREAMKALAAKGLIQLRPRTGTTVLPVTEWNLLDGRVLAWLRQADSDSLILHLTEVRRLVEPGAAALAARRAEAPEHRSLLAAFDGMEQAFKAGQREAFNQADIKFHRALLRMSHNPLLAALNSSLEIALEVTFEATSSAPGAFSTTLPLHRGVAEAVVAGDPLKAQELMESLIATSARHFAEVRNVGKT